MDKELTGSKIKEILFEDSRWSDLVDIGVVDLDEVKKYLVEFPDYIEQIKKLPDWLTAKYDWQWDEEFINFLVSFPAGEQRQDQAFFGLFNHVGSVFRLADLSEMTSTRVVNEIFSTIIDAFLNPFENNTGIYIWGQLRKALIELQEEITIDQYFKALKNHRITSIDFMEEYFNKLAWRDYEYASILPWESSEYNKLKEKSRDAEKFKRKRIQELASQ